MKHHKKSSVLNNFCQVFVQRVGIPGAAGQNPGHKLAVH